MQRALHTLLLALGSLALLLQLSGCGFHLRGSQDNFSANIPALVLDSQNAGTLGRDLKRRLERQGVTLLDSASEDSLRLTLLDYRRDRRVLSVTSRGRVSEYELIGQLRYQVQRGDTTLLGPDTIEVIRDFTFDEDQVIGKAEEEALLNKEIQRELVLQLLRRLQAQLQGQ